MFIRTIEDFVCEHCGTPVPGNGYTNHCPACLYSKHVDIHPGDRAATCHGMMEPVGLDIKKGAYVIVHRCVRCGAVRRNKTAPNDSAEQIIAISCSPLLDPGVGP